MKGTTKSGFEFSISDERLDNMELIDALGELENNPLAVSKVCTLLLGEKLKAELYDHVRNDEGIVPASSIEKEIAEIFHLYGATAKNW